MTNSNNKSLQAEAADSMVRRAAREGRRLRSIEDLIEFLTIDGLVSDEFIDCITTGQMRALLKTHRKEFEAVHGRRIDAIDPDQSLPDAHCSPSRDSGFGGPDEPNRSQERVCPENTSDIYSFELQVSVESTARGEDVILGRFLPEQQQSYIDQAVADRVAGETRRVEGGRIEKQVTWSIVAPDSVKGVGARTWCVVKHLDSNIELGTGWEDNSAGNMRIPNKSKAVELDGNVDDDDDTGNSDPYDPKNQPFVADFMAAYTIALLKRRAAKRPLGCGLETPRKKQRADDLPDG